jgi:hypothetical protein
MSENTEWQENHEKEQVLLRRCRKFVLGHPESPGGGSKDILYFTPCRRWLRICTGDIEYGDPDWRVVEVATRINSGLAAALFKKYGSWDQIGGSLAAKSPKWLI